MSTQVNLKGRLSSDPELKFTASGKALVRITVVTSRNRKTDEGWKEEDTTFWDVTLWEQDAEAVADSLSKGDQVIVMGDAYSRSWDDSNGEKRSRVEIRGRTVAAIVDRRQRVKVNRVQRQAAQQIAQENDPWATPAPIVGDSIDEMPF
jgi:single-strand DNA-binding protein